MSQRERRLTGTYVAFDADGKEYRIRHYTLYERGVECGYRLELDDGQLVSWRSKGEYSVPDIDCGEIYVTCPDLTAP